jgi:hypothetical protein
MAVRPNFTGVERTGDVVRVTGESGDDFSDIVDIQVVLAQADRLARKAVGRLGTVWDVEFPSEGFVAGPAVAFGWETRKENFTTISWAEPVDIPEPGEP